MQHTHRFEQLASDAKEHIKEITVKEVSEKLQRKEPFYFFDIREDHEWIAGHAQGAQHVGRGILERDIEKFVPNADATIVLYCGGGYRSALSAESLQKMGYTNVLSMAGGIRTWKEEGLPISKE